jgi:catechol 2,3-dioxygenase-like lactoylglutathione lyase family enzyme
MNFKLARALVCGSLLLAAALRPAAAESPTLLRTALIVDSAPRAMAFYELLGFRVEMDQANPRKPEGNPFPLNAPSTAVRLVIMQSESGAGGRIGLVEFSKPTPAEARRDPARTGRGDAVLVFDVADADAIHATMQRAGVSILEPPQVYLSKKTAPDGSPMRGKVFHVRDPDGYLIELLEAPRPAAP